LIYYIRNIEKCGVAAYDCVIRSLNRSELQMEFVPLALFAFAVVGLGVAATVLLTDWIPQSVAQLASQHGRFIGLGEQTGGAAAHAVSAVSFCAHVQPEAMNVVRTSN
jgi:hypothetical protein